MDRFDLHRRLASLTAEERSRYWDRLREAGLAGDLSRILPGDETQAAPASFMQQGLWFLDQLEARNPFYNLPLLIFRIRGPLVVDALQDALNALTRRHESLRTSFRIEDGHPFQVIDPDGTAAFAQIDLCDVARTAGEEGPPTSFEAREARAMAIAKEEAVRTYDLSQPPLWRSTLVRVDDEQHLLLVSMHHIISDAWSLGVFYRELGTLYGAFVRGEPSPLPPLAIQYTDFARWQRREFEGPGFASEIEYWTERLRGAPPLLELPTDHPRPGTQSYRGARVEVTVPPEVREGVKTLCQDQGVSIFMLLMTVLKTLLHRYTAETDLVVGTPVAGRDQIDTERLIGFFVNMVALRTDLSGDPTFEEVLRRVRDTMLDMYEHQRVPFAALVEKLNPQRDLSHHAIFQVVFGFQNTPSRPLELEGLSVDRLSVPRDASPFDLGLFCGIGEPFLETIELEFASDLFERSTAAQMLGHYRELLCAVVSDPKQRLSQLPMIPAEERQRLLARWGSRDNAAPERPTLAQAFEAQVARAPEAVALEFGAKRLTYAELDQAAERVAQHLRAHGVGPEAVVGVAMERSLEQVVALVGVAKSGGAYLPLDPGHPPQRVRFMLEDSGARVVLTRPRWRERVEGSPATLLCVEDLDRASPGEPTGAPARASSSGNIALVIYTSGSTGQPKGVCLEQNSVVRMVRDREYVKLGEGDRVASLSHVAFDAATFEIWGALANGARLVGIDTEDALSPHSLEAALRERGVTTLFIATALFNEVARARPGAFASLRDVLFGGEAADPSCVSKVLENGPPQQLLHMYGPSENTTFATWFRVEAVPEGATSVPIGRPMNGTRAYVLDEHLRPVPDGVSGELYLGGPRLARCYRGRAGHTAERFIPDPFSERGGDRLYRTGDRVRCRGDALEFVGRADQQVKVRGFRIEPGEVEAALLAHPEVAQAAVIAAREASGTLRLQACIVNEPGPAMSLAALRTHLRDRLPPYMMPAAYSFQDALPLTPNGKVDRRALEQLAWESQQQDEYVAPESAVEKAVAELLAGVIGIDRIGMQDHFFDLGGHSLHATQFVSRLQQQMGLVLPVRVVFEHPVVGELAGSIQAAQEGDGGAEAVQAIARVPRQARRGRRQRPDER